MRNTTIFSVAIKIQGTMGTLSSYRRDPQFVSTCESGSLEVVDILRAALPEKRLIIQ